MSNIKPYKDILRYLPNDSKPATNNTEKTNVSSEVYNNKRVIKSEYAFPLLVIHQYSLQTCEMKYICTNIIKYIKKNKLNIKKRTYFLKQEQFFTQA